MRSQSRTAFHQCFLIHQQQNTPLSLVSQRQICQTCISGFVNCVPIHRCPAVVASSSTFWHHNKHNTQNTQLLPLTLQTCRLKGRDREDMGYIPLRGKKAKGTVRSTHLSTGNSQAQRMQECANDAQEKHLNRGISKTESCEEKARVPKLTFTTIISHHHKADVLQQHNHSDGPAVGKHIMLGTLKTMW